MYHWTVYFRRTLFVTLFIAVCGLMSAPYARGADDSVAEEWIFNVIMPPTWTIAEAMIAYQFEGSYYLPAVELAEAGLIRENMRESAELAIGLVLILCWSALTVILLRLINAIKASAHSTRKGDDG